MPMPAPLSNNETDPNLAPDLLRLRIGFDGRYVRELRPDEFWGAACGTAQTRPPAMFCAAEMSWLSSRPYDQEISAPKRVDAQLVHRISRKDRRANTGERSGKSSLVCR